MINRDHYEYGSLVDGDELDIELQSRAAGMSATSLGVHKRCIELTSLGFRAASDFRKPIQRGSRFGNQYS